MHHLATSHGHWLNVLSYSLESNPSPTLSSYHSLLSKTIVATSGVGFDATKGCTFQRFGQLRSSECLESGITNLGWTSATGALGVSVFFLEGVTHINFIIYAEQGQGGRFCGVIAGDSFWRNSLEVKSWQLIIVTVCYMECFSEAKSWFASCRRCDLIQLCLCRTWFATQWRWASLGCDETFGPRRRIWRSSFDLPHGIEIPSLVIAGADNALQKSPVSFLWKFVHVSVRQKKRLQLRGALPC